MKKGVGPARVVTPVSLYLSPWEIFVKRMFFRSSFSVPILTTTCMYCFSSKRKTLKVFYFYNRLLCLQLNYWHDRKLISFGVSVYSFWYYVYKSLIFTKSDNFVKPRLARSTKNSFQSTSSFKFLVLIFIKLGIWSYFLHIYNLKFVRSSHNIKFQYSDFLKICSNDFDSILLKCSF